MSSSTTTTIRDTALTHRALNWVGYYAAVLIPILLMVFLTHVGWQAPKSPELEMPISILLLNQSVWVFPLIFAAIDVVAVLWFGPPADRQPGADWLWDPDVTLIVAYVSRGQNQETLRRATAQTQAALDSLGVRYAIESVTDLEVAPIYRLEPTTGKHYYYVVPREYETTQRTRFKARALQYLLEQRTKRLNGQENDGNVWVLHMDEESIIAPESVLGIQEFIAQYDLRHTAGAIGQGEILYNSCRYGKSPIIEAIDAMRPGADLGRFRIQYRLWHAPVFGTHGSFILTPARLERQITWDVGGYGTLAEDAYFGLIATERGVRFDWVNGFIREQSPFTLRDLIQQRKRWFCGLTHITRDPSLKFMTTIGLRLSLMVWKFSIVGCTASLIFLARNFLGGTNSPPYWAVLWIALCGGFFGCIYVVGAYRNVLHAQVSIGRKVFSVLFALFAWLVLVPAIVESFAVICAVLRPARHFYVIEKDLPA